MGIPAFANLATSQRSDGGFTLVELLMALLILTVGLLGLLQSVNIAYDHNLRRKLRDEAVAIAEEQLNVVRLNPALRETAPGNPVMTTFTTANQPVGGTLKEFRVSRESRAIGGSSNKLTVGVRWSFKNMSAVHEMYTIRKMPK